MIRVPETTGFPIITLGSETIKVLFSIASISESKASQPSPTPSNRGKPKTSPKGGTLRGGTLRVVLAPAGTSRTLRLGGSWVQSRYPGRARAIDLPHSVGLPQGCPSG